MHVSYIELLKHSAATADDAELERKMHRLPQTILENAMWHVCANDHARSEQWRNSSARQAFQILYALHELVMVTERY